MTSTNCDRRVFLVRLSAVALSPLAAPLASCTLVEARQFETGGEVSPPLGCEELLARSDSGDC